MWYRVVVTLWCVVAITTASTGRSYLEPKPDKYKDVEGCFISAIDKVIPVGEAATSPECILYSCEKNWFDFYTCGFINDGPNCTVTVDQSKPYPDCCPVRVCDDSDQAD